MHEHFYIINEYDGTSLAGPYAFHKLAHYVAEDYRKVGVLAIVRKG